MLDGSIDEGATTSSGTDPLDPKRPQTMTAAERKAKKEEELVKQRARMELHRLEQAANQKVENLAKNREEKE